MFADYAFRISLRSAGSERTDVVIDTFYSPRNFGYALMNAIYMRRQLRGVVKQLLYGLCALAQKRAPDGTPGALSPA
jgi:hypothetical protein